MKLRWVLVVSLCVCFFGQCSWSTQSRSEIPDITPLLTVTGPIPVTPNSHPFNAAGFLAVPIDLSRYGYIEEEYLVSGTANVYQEDAEGNISVEAANGAYTTRILVRRPRDQRKFSGNVIVNPMNPSTFEDLTEIWDDSWPYIMEHGDAYVGITIKPVAIVSLQKFDAKRYASLTMTSPLPPDSTCPTSTGTIGATVPHMENGLAWDIISQVGMLLKSDSPSNPLRGFSVKFLYGSGFSQTGAYMIRYVNSFHQRVKLNNGKPIFDGYLLGGAAAMTAINQCARPLPPGDHRNITSHVGVPVIRFMTQSDYGGGSALGGGGTTLSLRRPDGDTPDDPYRLYEIPGTSHINTFHIGSYARPEDFIAGGQPALVYDCAEPIPDQGRIKTYIADGALANLDEWVRTGKLPPKAERIKMITSAAGAPTTTPVSDKFGNLEGGVRSPYVDVPVATEVATSTPTGAMGPGGGCNALGHLIPFSAERLRQLYPAHADYVRKVSEEVDRMLDERWVTKTDAEAMKQEASRASIPPAR